MKPKEAMYLALAAGIFLIAGYIAYTQLVPKTATQKTVTVETVGAFDDHLNQDILTNFKDTTKTVDYNSPVDLTGLGNNEPFGK
jgi:hypothetical protein